jgi:hypothetical protein
VTAVLVSLIAVLTAGAAAAGELHIDESGAVLLITGDLDEPGILRAVSWAPKSVERVILATDSAHPVLEKKLRERIEKRKWSLCGKRCQKEVENEKPKWERLYPADRALEKAVLPNKGASPRGRSIAREQARLATLERRFSETGVDCRDAQSVRDFKDMVYLAFGHKKDPFDAPYSYHEATARCLCPETAGPAGRNKENPKRTMAWARPLWNDCGERRRSDDEASLFQELYGLDAGRARALEDCLCRSYWPSRRKR